MAPYFDDLDDPEEEVIPVKHPYLGAANSRAQRSNQDFSRRTAEPYPEPSG